MSKKYLYISINCNNIYLDITKQKWQVIIVNKINLKLIDTINISKEKEKIARAYRV